MSVLLFLYFFWNLWFSFVSSWFQLFHFYQESFGWFSVVLWKRFDFWSLELDTGNYLIEIWIFEIWDFGLKFEIWNLKPLDLGFETWYFEKLKLGILKICNLKFWTWNLKFEIFTTWNFGDFECKNWAFRMWNFKLGNENLELKIWDLGFEKNLKFEPEVLSLISSKRVVIPFLFFFLFFLKIYSSPFMMWFF